MRQRGDLSYNPAYNKGCSLHTSKSSADVAAPSTCPAMEFIDYDSVSEVLRIPKRTLYINVYRSEVEGRRFLALYIATTRPLWEIKAERITRLVKLCAMQLVVSKRRLDLDEAWIYSTWPQGDDDDGLVHTGGGAYYAPWRAADQYVYADFIRVPYPSGQPRTSES